MNCPTARDSGNGFDEYKQSQMELVGAVGINVARRGIALVAIDTEMISACGIPHDKHYMRRALRGSRAIRR